MAVSGAEPCTSALKRVASAMALRKPSNTPTWRILGTCVMGTRREELCELNRSGPSFLHQPWLSGSSVDCWTGCWFLRCRETPPHHADAALPHLCRAIRAQPLETRESD